MGNVIVYYKNGMPIYLKDIATVRHGYKERKAIIRMNGMEAVEIAIYKEGNANTVSVSRAVERRLRRVRDILSPDMKMVKVYDQAVKEVIYAGFIGGLLAIVILYFFLRNFWALVVLSVPIIAPIPALIMNFSFSWLYQSLSQMVEGPFPFP